MTSHFPGAVSDQPTTGEQGGGPLHTHVVTCLIMTSHVPGAVPDQPITGEQGGGPLHTHVVT